MELKLKQRVNKCSRTKKTKWIRRENVLCSRALDSAADASILDKCDIWYKYNRDAFHWGWWHLCSQFYLNFVLFSRTHYKWHRICKTETKHTPIQKHVIARYLFLIFFFLCLRKMRTRKMQMRENERIDSSRWAIRSVTKITPPSSYEHICVQLVVVTKFRWTFFVPISHETNSR